VTGATTVGAPYVGQAQTQPPRLAARTRGVRAVFDMYTRARVPYYVYAEVNGMIDKRSASSVDEANSIFAAIERSPGEVYVAIFDPTDPLWPGPAFDVYHATPQAAQTHLPIAGLLDDIADAFKGTIKSVASFVKHPPSWFAVAFPLFTMENQRYWAGKLGGSTGERFYDAGVKAVASKYLGPQGPQLVEAYNKVTEDAARGNLNAREILAKAPEIAKLATASKQGPDAFRDAVVTTKSAPKISGVQGEQVMHAYAGSDYVGADGHSYPEVASRALKNIAKKRVSPYYGYLRSGLNQRALLFGTLPDAQGWFNSHMQQQPDHDYAAVFALSNLDAPIPGMEHFNRTPMVGNEQVGNWWPFFLGLPVGGAAGYFLRRWQEPAATRPQVTPLRDIVRPLLPGGGAPAPGGTPPKVGYPWLDFVGHDYSVGDDPWVDFVGEDPWVDFVGEDPWVDFVGGNPSVGDAQWFDIVGNAPWMDIVGNEMVGSGDGYSVGGPWVEFAPWVGAQAEDAAAKRQASAQARSLIQSAIHDIAEYTPSMPPANYYVWWLAAPSPSSPGRRNVAFTPSPQILSFTTLDEAKDYVRALGQQSEVLARAVFDKTSRHWPNPVTWSKSDNPDHLSVIAEYVASKSATNTAGEYVGEWDTAVGSALDDVRARARMLAQKRRGTAIGVIHTTKDNLWHALSFDSPDDADDWLNTATQDQNAYTYAAYFDKRGGSWPAPYIEKLGGYSKAAPGPRPRRAPIVGATRAEIETYRKRAQQVATAKPGTAAVVVITSDGLEHAQSFRSLDDAIDGLTRVTSLPKSQYAYAGAFDKGTDGTAYVQQEEFGEASVPAPMSTATIHRDRPATTTGEW
jgi:hypothetical protein